MTEEALETAREEVTESQETDQTEKPEIPEGFIPVEQNQEEVNRQFRLRRVAETKHRDTERELEEARKQLAELQSKASEVVIPPEPEPFAEDAAEQWQKREEAILERGRLDERKRIAEEDEQRQTERAAKEREQLEIEAANDFNKRMLELGFDPLEMKKAADTLIENEPSEAMYDAIPAILKDPDGPMIVQYLASNPIEFDEINRMSPFEMANRINSVVRTKAQSLKPKTSQAPAPPETLDGGGVEQVEHPLLEGVKLE